MLISLDGETPFDVGLCPELRALDTDICSDDSFTSGVLYGTRDLALSGSLLLGTEDADRLAVYGEDEWRALEEAFYGLLGGHLIEGDGRFVARCTELRLIVDLVA